MSGAATWVKAVLDVVQLSWQIQLALLITSGTVVVFPVGWAEGLGLSDLIGVIRPVCFVTCLLMSVLLLITISGWIHGKVAVERGYRWVLNNLSDEERKALRYYIEHNTKSQAFPISDGVAHGLVGSGVLYRASNAGIASSFSFYFNLQPWAWKLLKKNPDYLVLSTEDASTATDS